MRCPLCGTEMRVAERAEETGKTQPDARYTLLKFACRSPQCSGYGRIQAEKAVPAAPPSPDTTTPGG